MKKVVYSVTKVNKEEKLKGVGYLVEDNLLIPATSSRCGDLQLIIKSEKEVELAKSLLQNAYNEN